MVGFLPGVVVDFARDAGGCSHQPDRVGRMEHRHLGRSGLKVSEISYGNWLTHGNQIEEDAALACVQAALDEGITTFDTADVYADTRAEAVLGGPSPGSGGDGLEIFTKVYWPTGPGPNDRGLSRKHLIEALRGVAAPAADRLRRPVPGPPLRRARRRWRRRCGRFDDLVRARARCCMSACRSGRRRRSPSGYESVPSWASTRIMSNQPQYSMLWRVIEAEVIPVSEKLGHRVRSCGRPSPRAC